MKERTKETTLAYIKDIAVRLHNPGVFGGASLMVGAGFSKNAESIGNRLTPPDWSELAIAMHDEIYPKPQMKEKVTKWEEQRLIKTSGKNVLHLAEEYIAFFDRNKINALIEKNISDDKFIPGELHKRLLSLNWSDVFTTNYDTLLEKTCRCLGHGKDYKIVLAQDGLPGSRGDKPRIVKLHGSIPGVKPYIISEEDFRRYPTKSAAFVNTVQQALIETTLCMIGFSGDDPNFLRWHGWLHDNLGENCPMIYLIGMFDSMSEAEISIFRNRKIAIVDLSTLLRGDEENRYVTAFELFFEQIEMVAVSNNFAKVAPYYGKDSWTWNEIEEEDFVKDLLKFTNDIMAEEGDFVLLPQEKNDEYRRYFYEKFENLLRNCKNVTSNYLQALSNIIKMLRLCLVPLYDNYAERLLDIYQKMDGLDTSIKSEWKLQIDLYLLQMYRIDGKFEEYQKILDRCNTYKNKMTNAQKAIYLLELAKYALSVFNVNEVKKTLDEIPVTNIKCEIAKAGMYIQIGETGKAKFVLNKVLDELQKKDYNDLLYASYKSYFSLCYSTLGWLERDDEYSDFDLRNNVYRTRSIILKIEEALRDKILNASIEDLRKENVFEVNRGQGKTIRIGGNPYQDLSFKFVLMLDELSLPLFKDQCALLPDAIKQITPTSNNAYWKASFLIRANNKEIIERMLSRRGIADYDSDLIKSLYDNLWKCVTHTEYKDPRYHTVCLNLYNALDALTRMAVYLSEDYIVELVQLMVRLGNSYPDEKGNDIYNFFARMSTRFNGMIGEKLVQEIFITAAPKLCLASFFVDLDMRIQETGTYYLGAIQQTKSENQEERDNGIAQIIILWRNAPNKKYQEQIVEALWKNQTDHLPNTKHFSQVVWEEIPHDKDVNFPALYKGYISKGISEDSSGNELFSCINLFYITSAFSNCRYEIIKWDFKELDRLLDSAEKNISKLNNNTRIGFFLGDDKNKLKYYYEFVMMIYVITKSEFDLDGLSNKAEVIINTLREKDINGGVFDAIKVLFDGNYAEAINNLKAAFWSNDQNVISEASLGFQVAYFIAKQGGKDTALIEEGVLEIIQNLQYSDIKLVKNIWSIVGQLITKILSANDIYQDQLATLFKSCIQSYSYRGKNGDKYYYEALYNCNMTLKRMHKDILDSGGSVREGLNNVIDYVISLGLPELSVLWE